MIRPLLTAIFEYFLAGIVFYKGKYQPKIISLVLFLLASYQLGEVILFLTNGGSMGIRVAYFSTTLLPPLGVLLIERITGKKYGYPLFQAIGLFFAFSFVVNPSIVSNFELGKYCVRVFAYSSVIASMWQAYYQFTLMYTMIVVLVNILKTKFEQKKKVLKQILFAYISFDIVAISLTKIFPNFKYSVASLMCALAIIAAVIFTKVSLNNNIKEDISDEKHLNG